MKKTCILQDTEKPVFTTDLLEAAKQMYGCGKYKTYALWMTGPTDPFMGNFDQIVRVKEDIVPGYDPRGICDILENLHLEDKFDSFLIPATNLGKMVAPRLAKRLQTGLATGVIDIRKENGQIEIIRTDQSGKTIEVIHPIQDRPVVMTIKPNMFESIPDKALKTTVLDYNKPIKTRSMIKRIKAEKNIQDYDIRESDILISGGGGVQEYFNELYPLAKVLNGNVSASRKLVDSGIAPRSIQVGQSGKTVSPRLYLALGIHGSIQHIAGLRQVETIISVNRSKNAPICSLSDIVVQGDAREFIDRLTKKISVHKSETRPETRPENKRS